MGYEVVSKFFLIHTALDKQLVPQNLRGELPDSSVNDLVACIDHNFEPTLNEYRKAVPFKQDFQGAFDVVLIERLLRRIKEKGWPKQALG